MGLFSKKKEERRKKKQKPAAVAATVPRKQWHKQRRQKPLPGLRCWVLAVLNVKLWRMPFKPPYRSWEWIRPSTM